MVEPANRLSVVREYYFSQKLREVASMKSQGIDVINMGIGSPDLPPHTDVIKALNQSSQLENSHGYQHYQGIPALRQGMGDFYRNYFGVTLDGQEILPMMGSKEAIFHISMAFLNPGDRVLIPNPGYPTYTSVSNLVGAEIVYYDLQPEHAWLPDFEQLEKLALQKFKLMWINYPHMPSGAKADKTTLGKLVRFAQRHEILLVNDNPYSLILNSQPISILAMEGSKSHCLELNSLSKSYNMSGWRVGMLCGHQQYLQQVIKVKSNMDSGMFLGIQEGAIAALQLDPKWFDKLNRKYARRRDLVWEIVDWIGATHDKESSGMFVWAKLPQEMDSKEYVNRLLKDKHIFIAPGDIFGSNGQGYIRFSLCVKVKQIQEALKRLKDHSYNMETRKSESL
jgi:aspartate/methionine/tyrosine aminotransferase